MSKNTYGNFKFFSKIDNYVGILNSLSAEDALNLGSLSNISLTNDRLFLLSKSPAKVTTYSLRSRDETFTPLPFSEFQGQGKITSLLFGGTVKNNEFYVAVGIFEEKHSNDTVRNTPSQGNGFSSDIRQKVCVAVWKTSDLSFVKKVTIPNVDGSRVKFVVDVKIDNDTASNMAIAFYCVDDSRSNIYIIQDPFNEYTQSKSRGNRGTGVEEIHICKDANIFGFGFCNSAKSTLLVTTDKYIWRVDAEKKVVTRVSSLSNSHTSSTDESQHEVFSQSGSRLQLADLSSGDHAVFAFDGDEDRSIDYDSHQYLVAALNDKLVVLGTNSRQQYQSTELEYHASLFSKSKVRAFWFKQYLVLHSKDAYGKHILSIYSLCGRLFRAYEYTFQRNQSIEDMTTIGDRCVLLIKTIPNQVTLPAEYSIFALEEKSMKRKLDILTKRFRYDHALELALSQLSSSTISGDANTDMLEEEISDILKKSGDYMISYNDYDKAIQRYLGEDLPGRRLNPSIIEKIRVEPSAVIKSFSEAQATGPLTKYLVKLHDINQADNEHTKLLLECYIRDLKYATTEKKRLEINRELDNFLNQSRSLEKQRPIQIIAIKTLRRAGYRNRALSQAYKEPQQDELIIQIEIEDYPVQEGRWNFKRALAHLESLKDFNLAVSLMEKHGSIFMRHIPQETTNVMVRLCTPGYRAKKIEDKKRQFPVDEIAESFEQDQKISKSLKGGFSLFGALDMMGYNDQFPSEADMNRDFGDFNFEVNPERFIKAFAGNDFWLMVFLENVVYSCNSKYRHRLPAVIYNTLLEIYLSHLAIEDSLSLPTSHKVPYVSYTLQKEKTLLHESYHVFSSGGPTSVGKNLSDVPEDEKSLTHQQEKIMHVIREYDYNICMASNELSGLSLEDRILKLLEMEDPTTQTPLYGLEHALVLVQTRNFEKGILYLYAKLNLHYDILQYYELKKNYSMVMKTLETHGQNDPNMWTKVLTYFSKEMETTDDVETLESHLNLLLEKIKETDILPPLVVIQVLSRNKSIKVGLVKDYLKQKLEKHQAMKLESENRIRALEGEIKKVSNEMDELKKRPRVFQKQKCCSDTCNKPLDLPAIHFMCLHSYHQRCLTNEEECPKCANKLKIAIHAHQTVNKPGQNNEAFDKMFKKDGFSAISHYLGLGIFRPSK